MQRIFPRALLACISEARAPHPGEIECVAQKIIREAFGDSVEEQVHELARKVANAALNGQDLAA